MPGLTYKDAGVNIDLGDVCSKIMAEACQKTYENRKGRMGEIEVWEKEGLHRIIVTNIGPYKMMLNSDGVGTKVEIAERVGYHGSIPFDLIAMLVDDSVRFGADPLVMSNIIDAKKLDKIVIEQLGKGMVQAAEEAGIAVVSGEIAELGMRVGGYSNSPYNWCGTVLSIIKNEKLIAGEHIRPGDCIISLREYGFRSNGLSLVRKTLQNKFGEEWHKEKYGAITLGHEVLTPSKIYAKKILELHGHYNEKPYVKLKGVAHITGGGIPGKLGRVLAPKKLGADLTDLFEPPGIMKCMQKWGNISDEEAYKTWNMGNGMLLIVSKKNDDVEKTIAALNRAGAYPDFVGQVTKNPGIRIKSKGYFKEGQTLEFD